MISVGSISPSEIQPNSRNAESVEKFLIRTGLNLHWISDFRISAAIQVVISPSSYSLTKLKFIVLTTFVESARLRSVEFKGAPSNSQPGVWDSIQEAPVLCYGFTTTGTIADAIQGRLASL